MQQMSALTPPLPPLPPLSLSVAAHFGRSLPILTRYRTCVLHAKQRLSIASSYNKQSNNKKNRVKKKYHSPLDPTHFNRIVSFISIIRIHFHISVRLTLDWRWISQQALTSFKLKSWIKSWDWLQLISSTLILLSNRWISPMIRQS